MPKSKLWFIGALLSLLGFYLLGSFTAASFNIVNWSYDQRAFLTFTWGILALIVFFGKALDK